MADGLSIFEVVVEGEGVASNGNYVVSSYDFFFEG